MRSLKPKANPEFVFCSEKPKTNEDYSSRKKILSFTFQNSDPSDWITFLSKAPEFQNPSHLVYSLIHQTPADAQLKLYKKLLENMNLQNTELAVILKSDTSDLLKETCFSVLLFMVLKPPEYQLAVHRLARSLVEQYMASDIIVFDCSMQTSAVFDEKRYNELLCITQLFETLYDPKTHDTRMFEGVQNFLSFMKLYYARNEILNVSRSFSSVLNALKGGVYGQCLPELELNFLSLKCFLSFHKEELKEFKRKQAMNLLFSILNCYNKTNRYKSTAILESVSECLGLCIDYFEGNVVKSFPNYLFKRLIIRRFDRSLIEKLLLKAHPEQVLAPVIEFFRDSYTPDLVFVPLEDLFVGKPYNLAILLQWLYPYNKLISSKASSLMVRPTISYNECQLLFGGKKLWDRFEHEMHIYKREHLVVALLAQNIDAVKFVLTKTKTKEEKEDMDSLFRDNGLGIFLLKYMRPSFNRILRRIPSIKKWIYPPGIPNEEFFAISLQRYMLDDLLVFSLELTGETMDFDIFGKEEEKMTSAEKPEEKEAPKKSKIIEEILRSEKVQEVAGVSRIYEYFLGCLPGGEKEINPDPRDTMRFACENMHKSYVKKERKNFELSFKFQELLGKFIEE